MDKATAQSNAKEQMLEMTERELAQNKGRLREGITILFRSLKKEEQQTYPVGAKQPQLPQSNFEVAHTDGVVDAAAADTVWSVAVFHR